MRFFSNESKESHDDAAQAEDQHPERVQSDPVSVPPQRAGSPWSSGPATEDADTDPPFHEPGPQPTAFGASTVGGAVAASAVANPQNDTWQATDRESAADDGVGDDRSVAPGDGVVRDDTAGDDAAGDDTLPTAGSHRVGPDDVDTSRRPEDVVDVALDDRGTFADPQVKGEPRTVEDDTPPDTSLTGSDTASPVLSDEGGFDDPKAVDPATGEKLDADASSDSDTVTTDEVLKDEGGFEDPKVVDPASGDTVDGGVAAPAAAAATGAPTVATLFGPDAQAFRDRWRDVQLRFVDSPKEATAEAASMVDEAVDRLAAALKGQKSTLTGGGDDTEKLRVELRGYRDLLNRILDL
jgi:hypothetical protein